MSNVQKPEALGMAIAHRLAVREEATAQVQVVDILARSSAAADLAFCGSGALHGCYLHQRRTQCLDFLAVPNTIAYLISALRDAGLNVKQAQVPHEYAIAVSGKAVADVSIKIRIYPQRVLAAETEMCSFSQHKSQSAAINTLKFSELVLTKLAHLYLRERPLDYLDVWMALKWMPDVVVQLQQMLTERSNSRSSYVPPYPFDAAFLMKRLQRIEAAWTTSISALSINSFSAGTFSGNISTGSPPDFHAVKADLDHWLRLLDSGGSSTFK